MSTDINDNAMSGPQEEHFAPIQSVNEPKKSDSSNKTAKIVFFVAVVAMLAAGGVYYAQKLVKKYKDAALATNDGTGKKENLISPEKSLAANAAGNPTRPGASGIDDDIGATKLKADASVRPLFGDDGKALTNSEGNAIGVDKEGKIVEVPPIQTAGSPGASNQKTPLPGSKTQQGNKSNGQAETANAPPGNANTKFVSRFGGSLFGDGADEKSKKAAEQTASQSTQADRTASIVEKALLNATGGASPMAGANSNNAQAQASRPSTGSGSGSGSAGQLLASTSITPTVMATKLGNQNFIIPKGRQADCILSTRISDEVPGFTSCVLTENVYSDNGKVLLLERGSEVTGEYGTSGQQGLRRLFVSWTRAKTPNGITIDWSSPGTDPLGGSGIPGYLDKRWFERIGAAYMLSIFKDALSVAVANTGSTNSGTTVVLGSSSSTVQTTNELANKILEDSMKTRPVLSINQGERISIYVARDLNFSSVYSLREAGGTGTVQIGK